MKSIRFWQRFPRVVRGMNLAQYIAPSAFGLFSALSPLACGGEAPPPAVATQAPAPPPPAPPAPDVSEVPTPRNLLGVVRVKEPAAVMKRVSELLAIPVTDEYVTEAMLDDKIPGLLDLSHPAELALSLDPDAVDKDPQYALSAALGAFDQVKPVLEEKFKLEPESNGVFRLTRKTEGKEKKGDDAFGAKGRKHCAIYPAADVPMRLVCAESPSVRKSLGPYLARTTPRASHPAALHVELNAKGYHQAADKLRAQIPDWIKDISEATEERDFLLAFFNELVDFGTDLDELELDADLKEKEIEAIFTTTFGDSKSRLVHIALAHPERAEAPPAALWRVPESSHVAFFHRGLDTSELGHAQELAFRAIDASVTKSKGKEDDIAAVHAALSHLLTVVASPSVFASGVDAHTLELARASKKGQKKLDDSKKAMDPARWSLGAVEQPVDRVLAAVDEYASLLRRPAIAKLVRDDSGGFLVSSIKSAPLPHTPSLPRGTKHYIAEVVDEIKDDAKEDAASINEKGTKKKATKKAVKHIERTSVHVLVAAADGGRTLVVEGVDQAVVATALARALAPSDALAKNDALEVMRRTPSSSGGFVDVCSFDDDGDPTAKSLGTGKTPITFTNLAHTGKNAGTGTFTTSVHIPWQTVACGVVGALLKH